MDDTEIVKKQNRRIADIATEGIYKHIKVKPEVVRTILVGFAKGQNIAETCQIERAKGNTFPTADIIYKYRIKNKAVDALFRKGYDTYFSNLVDKLVDISKREPDEEWIDAEDKVRIQVFQQQQKMEMDAIKFLISKVAQKTSHVYKTLEEKKYDDFKDGGGQIDLNSPTQTLEIKVGDGFIDNDTRRRMEGIFNGQYVEADEESNGVV